MAIIFMILYHTLYDLQVFYGYQFNIFGPFWKTFERGTAALFLFLVGLCFVISWKKSRSYRKFAQRGLRILGYGLIVSIVTYVIDPATFVRFGILHLIGVSMFMLPVFAPLRYWNVLLGVIILATGYFIEPGTVTSEFLIPFGLTPPGFFTVDHFPLVPWFAVTLIGVVAGFGYTSHPVRWTWIDPYRGTKTRYRAISAVRWLSERSLAIYMVHQPLLLMIFWLLRPFVTVGSSN